LGTFIHRDGEIQMGIFPKEVIAYFSMEIGLDPAIPTYSGGLGVLAGDTIRSAADLEIPMVAVTLLYRQGYYFQNLNEEGQQSEEPYRWSIDDYLELLETRVVVELNGRTVHLGVWRYKVTGINGFEVPVYFLDTALPENLTEDQHLTDNLYGGDSYYRLCQEVVLGIGGFKILRALGYEKIKRFHLNEGHAALMIPALIHETLVKRAQTAYITPDLIDEIREQCVFTTHTPVPAGHDQFPEDLAARVLGPQRWHIVKGCGQNDHLNLTALALHCSRFVNGVAMKHGQVSRNMFPGYPINSITNGVHAATWASLPFQKLYDRHLPEWRRDPFSLRYAISIPSDEIWTTHVEAKKLLLKHVNRVANVGFDKDIITIGFARRVTDYKRPTLLLHDIERLKSITQKVGPIQIVFAGKAHPRDQRGKELIREIHATIKIIENDIPIAYLPNYDMALGKLLCGGVDVWLNTPLPPLEASGTSGMKAAVNGVPSLSILDGWWVEGHIEGITGWCIEDGLCAGIEGREPLDACHASALYAKLEEGVLPCFYKDRNRFIGIMKDVISLNGAFFNSHRMLTQYLHQAYR
jgi:starch phosphorylase